MPSKDSLISDIISWDVRNWGRAIPLWDQALNNHSSPGLALELGSRKGGLSLYLALKGFRVLCTDLQSPEPLARQLHNKYHLNGAVNYGAIDATRIDLDTESVDAVAFKSLFPSVGRNHQLASQREVVTGVHRVLKKGGVMLFAENLQGTRLHMALRKRFNGWSSSCYYPSFSEFTELLSCFREWRAETFGFVANLGRTESQRTLLHYVDISVNPILRDDQKYLIYGYAVK